MTSNVPEIHILIPTFSSKISSPKEVLLSSEFGKKDAISEIAATIQLAGYSIVKSHEITLDNSKQLLNELQTIHKSGSGGVVVFNLCDGTELDG